MDVTETVTANRHTIEMYAALVGDDNPLHTDEEYVDRDETFVDDNIVHGALIQGWFSSVLNTIGKELDAEVVIVDLFTEFHNPLLVGRTVEITAIVNDDDLTDEKVIVDVGLRAVDPSNTTFEYATSSATLMIDQTVPRNDD